MMLRTDCLRSIYSELEKCLVVTIMGAVATELQSLGHRPNFFYLQHAMGLASSTGLGLALCLHHQKVVVFDGDGSLLMNLGTLSTLARYKPKNLVHVVFDNESLLSVGGFPTATSTGSDLEGIARAAGIPRACTVRTVEEFKAATRQAILGDELQTIVAKVEPVGPKAFVTDRVLLELVEELNAGRLRVVDLTLPLSPATPLLPLPPQWNNTPPFSLRQLSRYDERGPAWYRNAFETGEHTGTHFDAPVHWVTGKDLPDSTVDRIAPKKFIGPAFVIDVTKDVERNADFLLTSAHIRQWEAGHGRIPPGAWVLLRTGWSRRADPT